MKTQLSKLYFISYVSYKFKTWWVHPQEDSVIQYGMFCIHRFEQYGG